MAETTDHAWLYRRIFEESSMAILYADRDGTIRLWNSGAEVLFGYRAKEALGRSLDLIIPEKQRGRHWDGWKQVMETGVTRYGRDLLAVPALRKDGSRISIEFNIVLLRAPNGELLGAAATIQDVTVRWQQQREMKTRIASLEAELAKLGRGPKVGG